MSDIRLKLTPSRISHSSGLAENKNGGECPAVLTSEKSGSLTYIRPKSYINPRSITFGNCDSGRAAAPTTVATIAASV